MVCLHKHLVSSENTYLQFRVPLSTRTKWYQELKSTIPIFPGTRRIIHHHITVAFLESTPKSIDVPSIIDNALSDSVASSVVFDTIGVFLNQSKTRYIVNLSASNVPDAFKSTVNRIQSKLIDAGCTLGPFLFHVTLWEIPVQGADLAKLQERIKKIDLIPFKLKLSDVSYRYYKDNGPDIKNWKLL